MDTIHLPADMPTAPTACSPLNTNGHKPSSWTSPCTLIWPPPANPTISMTPSITAAWPRISWLSSKALRGPDRASGPTYRRIRFLPMRRPSPPSTSPCTSLTRRSSWLLTDVASVSISRGACHRVNGRTAEKHAIHNAVVGLGGQCGRGGTHLARPPFGRLTRCSGTQVTGISPLYRTAAWGMR